MNEVYVLDEDLDIVTVIDVYKSLIWANRYNQIGDCELYLPATAEALRVLKRGYFLKRPDDDMLCQINYIQLTTDADDGNYLVVKGVDAKQILDRRIITETMSTDGNAEQFIRDVVSKTCGADAAAERRIVNSYGEQMLVLGQAAGFSETLTGQVTYTNVGEKVREWDDRFGWGYRFTESAGTLYFELYTGTDRSAFVVFSENYDNLASSTYTEDGTNVATYVLVCGEGEGLARKRLGSGGGASLDRYEAFSDSSSITRGITWSDLIALYPTREQGGGGNIVPGNTKAEYHVDDLYLEVNDDIYLAWLQAHTIGGHVVVIDGVRYYNLRNATVAELPTATPDSNTQCILDLKVYMGLLSNAGIDVLSTLKLQTAFEGVIEPSTTFKYKQDYFLGDIVTISNQYGITVKARISEIIEVNDTNGYSVQPTFTYLEG